MKPVYYLSLVMILSACDMGHLGNPVLLPVGAVSSGFENTIYNARRAKVKSYISENYSDLIQELNTTAGPVFMQTAKLAKVHKTRVNQLYQQTKADMRLLTTDINNNVEFLTVIFMVHSGR